MVRRFSGNFRVLSPKLRLTKISSLRINLFQHLAHIIQPFADHMDNIAFPLEPAGGHHHSRKSGGLAKVLPHGWKHDQICHAGLVFQRHKRNPVCC